MTVDAHGLLGRVGAERGQDDGRQGQLNAAGMHLLADVHLLGLAAELGHPGIGPVHDLEDLGATLHGRSVGVKQHTETEAYLDLGAHRLNGHSLGKALDVLVGVRINVLLKGLHLQSAVRHGQAVRVRCRGERDLTSVKCGVI